MQHGFFKGRSTSTNLLQFVDYILNAMDNGNLMEALYTDFSKAFDRIDIPMLLFKLHKIGIEPGHLKWLESYLTDRQQIIKFDNTIIHRANNMLGFIKRFCYNFNDPYTIKTHYIAYVRSILEYCSTVWSPFSTTHEERLESVQKQFLLFALRKLGWTSFPLPSYKARCMLIDIQTLQERRPN